LQDIATRLTFAIYLKQNDMKILSTTTTKTNGLKSYNVTAHNLRSCQYALNLMSKPSEDFYDSIYSIKFNNLEEAEKVGEAFLQSEFDGVLANYEFAKSYK
jgi:hypothetical protein